jgi:hypothetical protein
MKTNLLCKIFSIIHAVVFSRPSSARLRLAAAGTLFFAAAALAATAMHPPELPWAVPTVTVGNEPRGVAPFGSVNASGLNGVDQTAELTKTFSKNLFSAKIKGRSGGLGLPNCAAHSEGSRLGCFEGKAGDTPATTANFCLTATGFFDSASLRSK